MPVCDLDQFRKLIGQPNIESKTDLEITFPDGTRWSFRAKSHASTGDLKAALQHILDQLRRE
jgi:hypothetical protein